MAKAFARYTLSLSCRALRAHAALARALLWLSLRDRRDGVEAMHRGGAMLRPSVAEKGSNLMLSKQPSLLPWLAGGLLLVCSAACTEQPTTDPEGGSAGAAGSRLPWPPFPGRAGNGGNVAEAGSGGRTGPGSDFPGWPRRPRGPAAGSGGNAGSDDSDAGLIDTTQTERVLGR